MEPHADNGNAELAAALGHIESLPLGDKVIVHNRESGAMVETNAFGAMLVDHLRAAPDDASAVHSIAAALGVPVGDVQGAVAETMARWRSDGLFLARMRPFPGAVPYRVAKGGVARRLCLGPRAVVLRIEDNALVDDLDRALAPMGLAAAHPEDASAPVRLEVLSEGPGYAVYRDGAPVWGVAGYELTRFHLLREIMDSLCGPDRIAAHLHASAMARGGAGLVFAGASGSGKSTLATLLLGAGAALAADDHVALDTSGEALLAFPTRPNLKPGTAQVPAVRAVIAAHAEDGPDFVPKARVPVGAGIRLAGLVFPRYAPGGENTLTPLAPDVALRELIQTGSRVSRSTRSIAPLLHALTTRPTCRLTYSDTDFAIAQCLSLLEA